MTVAHISLTSDQICILYDDAADDFMDDNNVCLWCEILNYFTVTPQKKTLGFYYVKIY